jgi:VCBS repeat protein/carboxypeptidase family protein
MLGNGDGTFLPSINYSSAPSPFSIVKGDFNSDGKLDLATANIQVDSVSILLGNGDGTFGSPVNYAAGGFPYELSTGDFNSDGKSDLVTAGNGGGLSILKGNGDGTFQKSVSFIGGGNFAAVLDLNGDAKPDIVSAQNPNSVAVFINQTGPFNISGAIRDDNNAPLSDVNVALTGGTPVLIKTDATGAFAFNELSAGENYTVTPSKPNYTFAQPNQIFNNLTANIVANFTGTLNHYSISGSVKDISGVGMAGVTMTLSGSTSGTITTGADSGYAFTNLAGGGNYTVTPSRAKFMFSPPSSTSNNLSSNRVVNFTGRVAAFTISGGVLSAENGSNIDGFTIELTGTRTGTAVTTSFGYSFSGLPVDGDYTVTAYLANRLFTNFKLLPPISRSFTALSSNVTANFSARRLAFGTGDSDPLGIASGDLNGDGKLDVAIATTTGSNIHVLLGNGDGTLQTQVAYPADSNPADVVIADFDGDRKADVASANIFGSDVSIFIGNGDGTLKTRVNYPVGSQPAFLSVSDFNNDGKLDLAALGGPNTLSILLGNGNGTFQPAITRTVATAVGSVLPGDLNGDGKPDLVLPGFPASVLVLVGRGDGTFDDPVSYPAADEVVKATLADLNSDGKLDVAVASRLPGVVTILLGRGDGTFQTGIKTSIPMTPADLISHDFDGNGKLDLVVAGDSGSFGFLSGNGDGTFSAAVVYQSGAFSRSLVAGDFNNDSKLDLTISQGSGEVSVLLTSSPTPLPPTIFIEEGTTNKAAALDSVTQLRGPFSVLNTHNFSADSHTRVMLFTSNLGLSQPDSAILSVRANGTLLTVENVGTVSGVQGLDASYIIVRLPDGLSQGNLPLTVTLHGIVSSNTPILEISP